MIDETPLDVDHALLLLAPATFFVDLSRCVLFALPRRAVAGFDGCAALVAGAVVGDT